MEVIEQQKEAKALVRELLEEDTRCRNDDLWLILRIWQKKQFIKLFVPFEELRRMIVPETITRVRRQIQNTYGQLLPTDPQILVKRKVKEDILRSYYRDNENLIQAWESIKFGVQ